MEIVAVLYLVHTVNYESDKKDRLNGKLFLATLTKLIVLVLCQFVLWKTREKERMWTFGQDTHQRWYTSK